MGAGAKRSDGTKDSSSAHGCTPLRKGPHTSTRRAQPGVSGLHCRLPSEESDSAAQMEGCIRQCSGQPDDMMPVAYAASPTGAHPLGARAVKDRP